MDVSVPADGIPAREPRTRRTFVRRLLRIVERGLAILGAFFLIYLLCFNLSYMVSNSMSPTLIGDGKAGSDYVLTERVSHWISGPKRWDLIAFHNSEGLLIMKRVVALPGENIAMTEDGSILIDGQWVPRPKSLEAVKYFPYGRLEKRKEVSAGQGYFVLGDDSRDSDDSRYNSPVQKDQIAGRPWVIVSPASRAGFVNP